MRKFFLIAGLAVLTAGCAALSGLPLDTSVLTPNNPGNLQILNQTDLRLQEGNFVTVKTNVVGQARGFALFGIITIVPAPFSKAMDRLYLKAEIQSGRPQTLADLVMEKTSTFLILFSIPKTTVRADVVEFLPVIKIEATPPGSSDKDSDPNSKPMVHPQAGATRARPGRSVRAAGLATAVPVNLPPAPRGSP